MLQIIGLLQTISISALFNIFHWNVLPTIRQTSNGPVDGIVQISALNQRYYSFQGIPFAAPPITGIDPHTGEQVDRRFKVRNVYNLFFVNEFFLLIRFQATEPLKRRWTFPLKVHNFGKKCIQSQRGKTNAPDFHEDCLFLNIYVPGMVKFIFSRYFKSNIHRINRKLVAQNGKQLQFISMVVLLTLVIQLMACMDRIFYYHKIMSL